MVLIVFLGSGELKSQVVEIWKGRGDYLYKYSNLWADRYSGNVSDTVVDDTAANFDQDNMEWILNYLAQKEVFDSTAAADIIYNSTDITQIIQNLYPFVGNTKILEKVASTKDGTYTEGKRDFYTQNAIKFDQLEVSFSVDGDLPSKIHPDHVEYIEPRHIQISRAISLIDPYTGESRDVEVWITYEPFY